jgi:hypothetical protein
MVTVSEGATPPAGPVEGDVWIRITAGIRQRYVFGWDKLSEAAAPVLTWVGFVPQGGGIAAHLAKQSAANAHGRWNNPADGLAFVFNQIDPQPSWTILNHGLAFRLLDVTIIRALDDWTWNPATSQWTDPQAAARPATIVMPRRMLASATGVILQFAEPVRGIALLRR